MPELDEILALLPTVQQVIFLSLAVFTAVGALVVALARNLYHNALGLIMSFFGVAGIYALLEAEFLAVSQVLVYVGAISTLITFAIMLTRSMMFGGTSKFNNQLLSVAITTSLLFFVLVGLLTNVPWPNDPQVLKAGEEIIADMGEMFVTTYLIPFELMAVMLLVALAGAIMLARDDEAR